MGEAAVEGLTFEKVWAMFQETRKQMAESSKETERLIAELTAKTDRQIDQVSQNIAELTAKTDRQIDQVSQNIGGLTAKTDRQIDKLSQNVGGLNRSMGELIETLIAARLWEKFSAYPYNLQRAYRRIPIYDEKNWARTEIDILLVDTIWGMAVEVKRELANYDVDYHVKRMDLILRYPPAELKGKKLLGAVAAGVVPPDVRDYAHGAGFFVLELTGESVGLIAPPEGFTPKEWV